MASLPIGAAVGARRWAYNAAHPRCWLKPWRGVLLAQTDPRAWRNSVAFPTLRPNREAVAAHVAWCRSWGGMKTVPVLWDFGARGKVVYWERPENVRAYADDMAEWERERAAAFAQDNDRAAARAA